jgi:hypothetical protein
VCLTLLVYIISALETLDCGTPVECYVKAVEALHEARRIFDTAKDKFGVLVDEAKAKLQAEINEVNTTINKRIDVYDQKIHIGVCRNGETNCREDGGGNLIFLDKHYNYCYEDEYMRGWQLIRCSDSLIKVVFSCCKHP